MDYRYAVMENMYNDNEVTRENAVDYIDPQRTIQTRCLAGFYCDSPTTMVTCPAGYWCAESFVEPIKCSAFSLCPENSSYELNFTNLILGGIFTIILLLLSSITIRRQQRAEALCRNNQKPTSSRSYSQLQQQDDNPNVSSSQYSSAVGLIEIMFQNIEYFVNNGERLIIPNLTGTIPAGKMTLLLGPSGW